MAADDILVRLENTIRSWSDEVTEAHRTLTSQIGGAKDQLNTLAKLLAARQRNGAAQLSGLAEMDELRAALTAEEAESDQLEAELRRVARERDALSAELAEYRARDREGADEQVAAAGELAELRRQQERQIEALLETREELRAIEKDIERKDAALAEASAERDTLAARLRETLSAAPKLRDRANVAEQRAEQAESRARSAEVRAAVLEENIDTLRRELSDSWAARDKAVAATEAAAAGDAEHQTALSHVAQLEAMLEAANARGEEFAAHLRASETRALESLAQLNERGDIAQRLREELAAAREALDSARAVPAESEAVFRRLQADAERREAALKEDLHAAQTERDEARFETEKMLGQLESAAARVRLLERDAEQKVARDVLDAVKRTADDTLQRAREEAAALEDALEQSQAARSALKARVAELEAELANVEVELDEVETEDVHLATEREHLDSQLSSALSKVAELGQLLDERDPRRRAKGDASWTVRGSLFDGRGLRRKMGEVLLEAGMVTERQLESALLEQKAADHRRRIGTILVEKGYVFEEAVAQVVARQLGIEYVRLDDQQPERAALELVDGGFATHHLLVPLRREKGELIVAMANPGDQAAVSELERRTGLTVKPMAATLADISTAIVRCFGSRDARAARSS